MKGKKARVAVMGAAFAAGIALLAPGLAAAGDFSPDPADQKAALADETSQSKAFFLWSWGHDDQAAKGTPAPMTGLALTFPEGSRGAGTGFGLGAPHAFGLWGEDVGLSVGAAVTPRPYPAVPDLSSAFESNDSGQAGVGGRLSLHQFSLGGAYIGMREDPATRFGPRGSFTGGHDIDVSYSFGTGSVSLSHVSGADVLGMSQPGHESMAVSGHYLLGRNLDMTALFALENTGPGDPIGAALEGFALRAGFRLSF